MPCTSKTSNAEAHADMYIDTHTIAPMFSHRSATAVVSNCIYIPIGIIVAWFFDVRFGVS